MCVCVCVLVLVLVLVWRCVYACSLLCECMRMSAHVCVHRWAHVCVRFQRQPPLACMYSTSGVEVRCRWEGRRMSKDSQRWTGRGRSDLPLRGVHRWTAGRLGRVSSLGFAWGAIVVAALLGHACAHAHDRLHARAEARAFALARDCMRACMRSVCARMCAQGCRGVEG